MGAICEKTSFKISAKVDGHDVQIEIGDIQGNTEESISRSRLVRVLAVAIVGVARGDEDDGRPDFELLQLANETMNEYFVSMDCNPYRITK